MKELLKKKLQERKKKGNEKGFTLIEILVVLVIMGFLIAMVAPKLAGISDRAVDVTDDNSQKRLQEIMQVWINTKGSLPPALANMDITAHTAGPPNNAADFIMASIDDGNSANGAEVISKEFADKWLPMPHYLNAAEVAELRPIIGSATMHYGLVGTLTDTTPADGVQDAGTQGAIIERYMRKPLSPNQCVMMIGAGMDAAGVGAYATGPLVTLTGSALTVDMDPANFTSTALAAGAGQLATSSNYQAGDLTYARIGEAPMALRIVMGMTDRNKIVNSGMLDKAGVSPKATQSTNYEFGNYYVVVPRLQATAARFLADPGLQVGALPPGLAAADTVVQHSIAFNEEEDSTFTLVARTPHSPGNTSGVAMPGQLNTATVILSPEGDKWAANRSDWFGIGMATGHGKIVL